MESSTECLCRMLDERGVKHRAIGDATFWETHDGAFRYKAKPHADKLMVMTCCSQKCTVMTPEQAVAATLGLGTCHAIDTGCATAVCSVCGAEFMGSIMTNEPPDYVKPLTRCPECGRKIVEVDDG